MLSPRGGCRGLVGVALLAAACGANKEGLSRPPEVSASPVLDEPAPEPPEVLPGAELFIEGKVLEVRLTLATELLRELEEHGDREEYVAATARLQLQGEAARELGEIGVRYKGDYSLHHCWDQFGGVRSYADECAKLSLKLKFDARDPELRLAGLKRLNLHAASSDATKLHELLAYRTFRDAGIRAPRTLPAQVFINDVPRGLYVAVEDIDGRFTRAHFPDAPDGNLYKEIWPNPAFSDAELLAALQTNEERADVSGLRAFADAVGRASSGSFAREVGPFIDVDALLRYLAVDRALRNWDGVTAFYSVRTSHNFFWYHDDASSPRFHLIPWDLDSTFWAFHPYAQPEQWVTAPPVPDLNERPLSCERRVIWEAAGTERVMPPRCDKLLNWLAEANWSRLVGLGQELSAGPLAPARLRELARGYAEQLAPIVEADPTLDTETWRRALSELDGILPTIAPGLQALLDEGLVDERPLEQVELAPPADVDGVTVDGGLHVGSVTNFEFAAPPASEPAGVFSYADPLATVGVSWSTAEPLSGTADLRFDFTFQRGPQPYDEWAGIGIGSPESDLSGYSRIIVWMSADRFREVRVRVGSAAYEQEFGGILQEFGLEHVVGPTPQPFVIELARVYYPAWAKEGWEAGQGFSGADADARERVLQRFTGLVFGPDATVDAAGELSAETETGYLRIDNIYFQ